MKGLNEIKKMLISGGRSFAHLRSQYLNPEFLPEEYIIYFHGEEEFITTIHGDELRIFDLLVEVKEETLTAPKRGEVLTTPDGKRFLIQGSFGSPSSTSSMNFLPLSEEEFLSLLARKKQEAEVREKSFQARQRAEEVKKERAYLTYRSSIRGLTEGLGLSILCRCNVAAGMPPAYMICRNTRDPYVSSKESFDEIYSFCSIEGCYIFLKKIVKYVRQTNGGRISREAWDSLDLEKGLDFAIECCQKHYMEWLSNH